MREKQKKIIQWSSLALILLTGIIVWRVNYEIDFILAKRNKIIPIELGGYSEHGNDVYTGVADLPGCRQSPYALLFCGTGNAVWTECQLENEHVLGSGCSELSVHDRIYPGVSALLSEI